MYLSDKTNRPLELSAKLLQKLKIHVFDLPKQSSFSVNVSPFGTYNDANAFNTGFDVTQAILCNFIGH